ncbi:MAG TPA: crossover junction endodeoxyribonuclease RuvC [Steroidobacter sp.]|uniref:crossover junction endodeoxyribonuclease RuvC n=1 Tax=Steroidobacter sp. TaxID=1978227 RepID=UPI002ED9DD1A
MRRHRRPKSLAELNLARSPAQRDGQSRSRSELAKASSAAFVSLPRPAATPPARVRILGLDPGSLCTGYAVIETGPRVTYVVSGSIRARGASLADRLQEIFAGVDRLANEYQPDEVAIERVFMHRNADSALKLGQARGAALSATFAVRPRVFEYAPREVKLAVVGTGGAQKEQVQLMVRRLLNLSGRMGADAADALAIALCHAHSRGLSGQLHQLAAGGAR